MPRWIACLTYDFDAFSGFVSRGLDTPTPVSRGEFGTVGVERILKMLSKYDIKGSFFTPGTTIENYPKSVEAILEAGHELGHHGWTHDTPASLGDRDTEEAHLVRANESIERISGQKARGYRSPAWDLSPYTVELLLKHGFLYDSSMMGHDCLPYYARQGDIIRNDEPSTFGETTSLIEMPISWSLDDHPHFEFVRAQGWVMPGLANANAVLENFIDEFVYMTREQDWGILTYTFHPYVVGRGHRMLMMERLIAKLIELGAEFMRLEDAAEVFSQRADQHTKA